MCVCSPSLCVCSPSLCVRSPSLSRTRSVTECLRDPATIGDMRLRAEVLLCVQHDSFYSPFADSIRSCALSPPHRPHILFASSPCSVLLSLLCSSVPYVCSSLPLFVFVFLFNHNPFFFYARTFHLPPHYVNPHYTPALFLYVSRIHTFVFPCMSSLSPRCHVAQSLQNSLSSSFSLFPLSIPAFSLSLSFSLLHPTPPPLSSLCLCLPPSLSGLEHELVLHEKLRAIGVPFSTESEMRLSGADCTPDVKLQMPIGQYSY